MLLGSGGERANHGIFPDHTSRFQQSSCPFSVVHRNGDVECERIDPSGQRFGELTVFLADAEIIHAPVDDLRHQKLATLARTEADAPPSAREPGPAAALEQTLEID